LEAQLRRRIRALLTISLLGCGAANCAGRPDAVAVGSKNFSESILLGEILAQVLEARGIPVQRKFNLGGTFICHQGLISGDLDAYVEYTGTAYAAILELPVERDQAVVRATLEREYRERWDVRWMGGLGFNNTYAMLIRGAVARELGLTRFSEAVPYARSWRGGFGFEFEARADGLNGLLEWYGFELERKPLAMELGLMYRALADGAVDLVAGNSTDGQIESLDLVHLEDDRGYFPVYDAVTLVRNGVFIRFPDARSAIALLENSMDEDTMRRLNFAVDGEQRDVKDVAAEFLAGLSGR
jgi:osmoprotectant transport system substrate-binding protein